MEFLCHDIFTTWQKILLLVLVVVSSQSDTQECDILTGMSAVALMGHVQHGIFVMSKSSVSVVVIMVTEWYVTMRISVLLN